MTESKSDDGQGDGPSPTFWERHSDRILGAMALGVLTLGTVAYHFLESWSWVDSFYFSSVAGTTVGFGDLSPTTDVSKLVSVAYIFLAISILGTFLDQRLKYHGSFVKTQTKRVISEAPGDDQT